MLAFYCGTICLGNETSPIKGGGMALIETESGVERESAVLCCVCGYRSAAGRKASGRARYGRVCLQCHPCQPARGAWYLDVYVLQAPAREAGVVLLN